MSSETVAAAIAIAKSRYLSKRRCIKWNADTWVAILKMASWAEVQARGAGNAYTMWCGLESRLHFVFERLTGEVGVTLHRVIDHVRETQGLLITPEKLYARAWNVEHNNEQNEWADDVLEAYEALQAEGSERA
jgi:hypothetical protein